MYNRFLTPTLRNRTYVCSDPRLLPGAGAVELELTKRLKAFADEVVGLDQYAIRKFADAFNIVPRTLVENSGNFPSVVLFTYMFTIVTTIISFYYILFNACFCDNLLTSYVPSIFKVVMRRQ